MNQSYWPGNRLKRFGALAIIVLLTVPALAALLDRVEFTVPKDRENRFEGTFDIALGNVTVGQAEAGQLFQAVVDLQDDRLRPEMNVVREDRVARVKLGLDSEANTSVSWSSFRGRSKNSWALYFARDIPLDLTFDLGLAEADLDLTGFRVENLSIKAGMATARLAFDERNRIVMSHLQVDAGAARFNAENLGNARFEQMTFRGGAGSFTLDFGGAALPAGARADIDVGVSRLRILLPEDKAVVLSAPDSWLTRVDVPNGYTRASRGVWHSASVSDPETAFHINVSAGVGRVTCETVARTEPPPRRPRR